MSPRKASPVVPRPEPPPGLLEHEEDVRHYHAGIAAFNNAEHYEAHDHFEALWGEDFWKGLVQAAVALHHHSVRNPKGIEGLPENVERILGPYRPAYAGIDIDRFLREFGAYFNRVQAGEEPSLEEAPRLRPTAP